jgi:DNA-binding PadR family transcriptional regulator
VTRRGETLELAVLGLLHERPMHGYELRKQLGGVLGWGRLLSYGSLYPALKKMLKAGWITEHVATPPGSARAAASRRQRIVYELTPTGSDRFTSALSEAGPSTWEDDSFDVRFAFFGRTDLAIRLRILEGRRARLEERMARVQAQLNRTQQELDMYAAELHRHGMESAQAEVRWLSELIAAERDRAAGPSGSATGAPATPDSNTPAG